MSAERVIRGEAPARAALAGNPSDGFGGAVLAFTLGQLRAVACARPAARFAVQPSAELIDATVARFRREHAPDAEPALIQWSTNVPQGVGLGGSSAIVIAVLRALCGLNGLHLAPLDLARLALSIEVDDLGIAAGLQDRLAQSLGCPVYMDFGAEPPRFTTLDPALLPPLLVAWRLASGGHSGAVHAPLRDRFAAGEPVVRESLRELGRLAAGAHDALTRSDHFTFAACVDASYDARERMLTLDERHTEMVRCARAGGAAANYTGSGGAIVAVCHDEEHRRRLSGELDAIGCATLVPRLEAAVQPIVPSTSGISRPAPAIRS